MWGGIQMGWKIIKDNCSKPEEKDYYKKGKEYGNYKGGKYRYRLLDDDGEVYFYLLSDIDPNNGTESQIFEPLDWGMNFAGCSAIQYKDEETGEYKFL
jgi:hypothetical protein